MNWCIEYNEQYRKQHPPTALWLTNIEKPLSGLLNELALVYFRQDKQLGIPLEIPLHVERKAILKSLVEKVSEVSKRFFIK